MASFTVAATEIGSYAHTLAASTVDTVSFAKEVGVEVWTDGTAAVYFTTDGSTPVAGANATYEIPAGASQRKVYGQEQHGPTVVKLISAGTPKYSVTGS